MSEKEQLIQLVKESSSLTEILRKQGKSVSGTAMSILKQKLEEYNIPYFFIKEKVVNKKLSLTDILKENRPYSSTRLKEKLLNEGLKENICEICGQKPIWNNKILNLQLDHINGNHNDNRLENLRIVCPNCHSQTDTFCGKKDKHNYCIDCGKEISPKSTRCNSCARKTRIRYKVKPENRPSKEELLILIKTKSFVEIGKMYGVSDGAIRKWCKKYGLPKSKTESKNLILNSTDHDK